VASIGWIVAGFTSSLRYDFLLVMRKGLSEAANWSIDARFDFSVGNHTFETVLWGSFFVWVF